MQSIISLFVGRLKTTLTMFVCLLIVDGIRTTKIGIGENREFHKGLKTCLSTLIETICPDCTALQLVIPRKPAWEADALTSHFYDPSRMYAIQMHTIDQPSYQDLSFDQVGCYLVNTEADLEMALKHLPQTISERSLVVLVNFYFGHHLGSYLQRTIPVSCNGSSPRRVLFVALIERSVQVFGSPLQGSRTSSVKSFRQLSICDTKGLIEVPQPLSKVIEYQKSILTVAVRPAIRPYIYRKTEDPGGFVGRFIEIMESQLNFTTKYVWPVEEDNISKFIEGDGLRMAFNLYGNTKTASHSWITFLETDGIWVIAIPNQLDEQNILTRPLKNSILLHVLLLAIYIIIMVYLSRELDKTRIIVRLFGMFFGIGVGWLPRKALNRFLVVLWCFTSYHVLVQAYLAGLTSELSSPISRKSFRNTEDLMESGIDIFCLRGAKDLYCNLENEPDIYICEKCVIPDSSWILQYFFNQRFAITKTWRPFAFAIDSRVLNSHFARKSLSVMQEPLGSWPGMIYSNTGTEFLEKFKPTTEYLVEAGLFNYWISQHSNNNVSSDEVEHEMLNMRNLNSIFIILYIGWSCSMVVFSIELLIKWYRNK